MFTIWTRGRDVFVIAACVTNELIAIGVESKREETIRAESLPATVFADGKGGGTATIMEDECLVVIF